MQNVNSQKYKKVIQKILSDIKKNGLVIIIVTVGLFVINYIFGSICPVAISFGVPCPGCGMTRAIKALIHGQFMQAAYYNAAVYVWIMYAIYWFADRYIFEKERKRVSTALLIAVCLFTIIYYIYRLYTGTIVEVEKNGRILLLFDYLCNKI